MKPYGVAETFDLKIAGEERLTLEFVGQTQSLSVTRRVGEAKYAGMQRALREFFARWSLDGMVRMESRCEWWVGGRDRCSLSRAAKDMFAKSGGRG